MAIPSKEDAIDKEGATDVACERDHEQNQFIQSSEKEAVPDVPTDQDTTSQNCCDSLSARFFPYGFKTSSVELFGIAFPIMLSQLNTLLFIFTSTPFVGRLGDQAKLSAIGLAGSFANVAGMSFMWGLSTGAETLGSQAWGAGNKRRLGLICQRCFLIGLAAVLPCVALYLSVAPVLALLKQDPEVIEHCKLYIYALLPTLPLTALYIAVMKFLQTQQVVLPVCFAGLLSNGFNFIFHHLFINILGLGLLGAALATDLTVLIFGLSMLLYIRVRNLHKECWGGWTWECLDGWGEYLRLAVPGMFMICLEWWAFEIGMITTGILGKQFLAANTLCLQFASYAYLILSGVQIASIILVGNYLGEGSGSKAMTTARVTIAWGIIFGTAFFLIFFLLHDQLPYIMTNDVEVIQLTSQAMKVVAVMQFVDSMVNVTSGVIKGAGKQIFGAVTNFVGYYVIALPLGVVMMMDFGAGWKVPGYWWGQVIGLSIQSSVYIAYLTCRIDWDRTAVNAAQRARATRASIVIAVAVGDQREKGEVEVKGTPSVEERRNCVSNHWGKLIFVIVFLAALIICLSNSVVNHQIDLNCLKNNSSHCGPANSSVPFNITRPNATGW